MVDNKGKLDRDDLGKGKLDRDDLDRDDLDKGKLDRDEGRCPRPQRQCLNDLTQTRTGS